MSLGTLLRWLDPSKQKQSKRSLNRGVSISLLILFLGANFVHSSAAQSADSQIEKTASQGTPAGSRISGAYFLPNDFRFHTTSLGLRFDPRPISTEEAGDGASPATEDATKILPLGGSAVLFEPSEWSNPSAGSFSALESLSQPVASHPESQASLGDKPGEDSKPSAVELVRNSKPDDPSRRVYYKNKLEFSLDGGWLPINIPFVFDVFLGDGYNTTPLKYTLVPIIASLRWQMDDVGGPWIFRGNWDLTASAAVIVIPRGPETRYFAWIMGVRRNFVPRRGRVAPYFDGRLGLGSIDAKEPSGVLFSQGQDFTFTMNMGSGVRYNFNPRYSISAGLNWMHISNLYLSEPRFPNYGINVYGPMLGIDIQLHRHQHSSQ